MWERRIFYGIALLGSLVFYGIYQEWLSFILLLTVVLLPWFSLVLSLPAMLQVKVHLRCPAVTRMGVPTRTALEVTCFFPAPPVRCKLRLVNELTGESYVGLPGERIPVEHCGRMRITFPLLVAYDYLGLFRKRLPVQEDCRVFILPKPVEGKLQPLGNKHSNVYKPKPGGGVTEQYELRLYRPGDELRHIHWKMSAKTGKLIYREAYEEAKKGYVLTLHLSGSPDVLDRKLGNLLWTSRALLGQKQPHTVQCLTGKGLTTFLVTNENTLEEGLCNLLSMPCAKSGEKLQAEDAVWQQEIGGDGDES